MTIRQLFFATTLLYAFFAFGLSACYYDNRDELYQHFNNTCDTTAEVSYKLEIISILEQHCLSCHSEGNSLGGNIFLANYNQTKAKVDDGSFYGSVVHDGAYSLMPPSGQKIPDCQIAQIASWIAAGAPDN